VRIPQSGGGYRLFAYVYDGRGNAAVANQPLHVDGPFIPSPAPKAELPLVVYGEGQQGRPYVPSGYMGSTDAIRMTPDCPDEPQEGKTCLKVEYTNSDDWGGVVWQSPANDWGERPGGFDLSGAAELEFWVRGGRGGEKVDFLVGILDGEEKYPDTAKVELKGIQLTDQWQKLRIPLEGRDLSRIKTAFGWTLAGQGRAVTFYLDEIRFVRGER
jgi:hypothetical protein